MQQKISTTDIRERNITNPGPMLFAAALFFRTALLGCFLGLCIASGRAVFLL